MSALILFIRYKQSVYQFIKGNLTVQVKLIRTRHGGLKVTGETLVSNLIQSTFSYPEPFYLETLLFGQDFQGRMCIYHRGGSRFWSGGEPKLDFGGFSARVTRKRCAVIARVLHPRRNITLPETCPKTHQNIWEYSNMHSGTAGKQHFHVSARVKDSIWLFILGCATGGTTYKATYFAPPPPNRGPLPRSTPHLIHM